MFSDIVTLFCWKMSRRTPSETHPLGYGKYETMGGLGVSVVLVAGALGIGAHSYGLLLHALEPTLLNAPAFLQTLGAWTGAMASGASHLHEHSHDDAAGLLDPNAMWFAAASVAVKEWLYRATLKVAKEENSSVLEVRVPKASAAAELLTTVLQANALHHRSDSLSSGVTFLAILGSWLGFPVLDPLGGLLVAGLIGKQGFELLLSALGDLTDRGVEPEVREELARVLQETLDGLEAAAPQGVTFKELTGVKHGVAMIVDVTLCMPAGTTLQQAHEVELKVVRALEESNKGVSSAECAMNLAGAAC
jgi:cation diffusion facilitator family transporter